MGRPDSGFMRLDRHGLQSQVVLPEKELQVAAAILECTDKAFLPPEILDQIEQGGGRGAVEERYARLRRLIELR